MASRFVNLAPALRRTALCAVVLSAACRQRARQPVETDLVGLFRYTASGQDTTEVDFGSAQSAAYLGVGWSAPEIGSSGESVARAVERKAIVTLTFAGPADRVMVVRCGAAHLPSKRPPAVIVRLNGRRIDAFTVQAGMAEHRIALPAAVQRTGANEVAFSARLGHGDERLDVAYDFLDIQTATGEHRAAPRLDGDGIVLPAGSTVSYFVRLPDRAALHFGVEDGGRQGQLRASVQGEGAAAQTLFTGASTTATDVSLRSLAGEIVRLAFNNDGGGALRVVGPRLRGSNLVPEQGAMAREQGPRRNVILYVIDTLRADHLGCYGYARPTSPQIDAFAREGVLFTHVVGQASWTRPSTASILTGRYPPDHGATSIRKGLRPGVATLAELLHQQGYRTAAFVTNVNVAPQWGFQRGFDLYRYLPEDEHSPTVHVGSDVLNAQALDWLTANGEPPFFLYLHATDPHAPYRPPAPWAERLADPTVAVAPERVDGILDAFRRQGIRPTPDELRALVARYDGEIAFTDDNFGRLLTELRRRGLYEQTLIIVVADHGEEFLEHGGFEHGRTLYDEMLHVPLIMRLPGARGAGGRVAATVRQIDVLPTVLDYLAVSLPADLPGQSLLTTVGGGDIGQVDALAESNLGRQVLEAIVTGNWKVIRQKSAGAGREEAYDRQVDPAEHDDRAEQRPVLLGYARQALAAWVGGTTQQREGTAETAPAPDPAIMERLRALGYAD